MSQFHRVVAVGALLATAGACASTRLTNSWKAPDAEPLRFEKVMTLALVSDNTARRVVEDEIAKYIQRAETVAGYTLLPNAEDIKDEEKVRDAVRSAGVDGAIVIRPVYNEKELTYVPGTYAYPASYYSFLGYYGWYWGTAYPAVYDPGYVRTDHVVGIETNIYSVANEKLVWSGLTKTTNPKDIRSLIKEVARAVGKEMKKQGLLD